MSNPFLAEIRLFSFGFAPRGWAFCNGQLLPINQNQALFSLLGTTYGGNGQVNFALPEFRGRAPMHRGNGHTLGERAGEEGHTLSISELPAHSHVPVGTTANADKFSGAGNVWAASPQDPYVTSASAPVALHPSSIGNSGGSQAHLNLQPYLTLNFCIALQGIFPSQN